MQTSTQADAPVIAQTPKAPVTITMPGPDGKTQTLSVPTTQSEVDELVARRAELSDQLTSVSDRRGQLAQEIRTWNNPATQKGLEDRLALLDQRILQLETDLASTGRLITLAPTELTSSTLSESQQGGGDGFEDGMAVGGFSVFFIMSAVLFFARRRWKHQRKAAPAQLGSESAQRLERLENGMDAIAVEIERVSEGQRFVTKLLSESQSPVEKQRVQ